MQEAIHVYQSHSESLVLTAHANQNLQKARSDDYQLYARSLYGFQESLTLWSENHRARLLLTETQRDYAKNAVEKGDLDLASSLLDEKQPEHEPIIKRIDNAGGRTRATPLAIGEASRGWPDCWHHCDGIDCLLPSQ